MDSWICLCLCSDVFVLNLCVLVSLGLWICVFGIVGVCKCVSSGLCVFAS